MVWTRGAARSRRRCTCDCGDRGAAARRRFAWEYWNGKDWHAARPAEGRDARVHAQRPRAMLRRRRRRRVSGPLAARRRSARSREPRYWIRARLVERRLPALAAAARGAHEHRAGAAGADGRRRSARAARPGWTTRCSRSRTAPVLAGTLELVVDEGRGFEPWNEVPTSSPRVPTTGTTCSNRSTGEVRFGRRHAGCACRSPIRTGRPTSSRARIASAAGVPATSAPGSVNDAARRRRAASTRAASATCSPAYGGSDEETLDAARERAPQTLKSHERAVTAEDFELHARAAGGVARAKALPLFHPQFEGVEVPGVVSVIVVPQTANADPLDDPAPMPTEGTLRNVCAYLDRAPPCHHRALRARAALPRDRRDRDADRAGADADLGGGEAGGAHRRCARYFHPLIGGDDGTAEAREAAGRSAATSSTPSLSCSACCCRACGASATSSSARRRNTARVQRRAARRSCAAQERRTRDHRAVRERRMRRERALPAARRAAAARSAHAALDARLGWRTRAIRCSRKRVDVDPAHRRPRAGAAAGQRSPARRAERQLRRPGVARPRGAAAGRQHRAARSRAHRLLRLDPLRLRVRRPWPCLRAGDARLPPTVVSARVRLRSTAARRRLRDIASSCSTRERRRCAARGRAPACPGGVSVDARRRGGDAATAHRRRRSGERRHARVLRQRRALRLHRRAGRVRVARGRLRRLALRAPRRRRRCADRRSRPCGRSSAPRLRPAEIGARFACLPVGVRGRRSGRRRAPVRCRRATTPVLVDASGAIVDAGSPSLRCRTRRPGTWISEPLDSEIAGCVWDRIELHGCRAAGHAHRGRRR